jgi:hypothetical protein
MTAIPERELEQMRNELREKLQGLIEAGQGREFDCSNEIHYPPSEDPTPDYTLQLFKPVIAKGYDDPKLLAAVHRALKTRRQVILRLLRRNPGIARRAELKAELDLLADLETDHFGVHHRATALPLSANGKPYVPKTARGKKHVPLYALPLNARGKRHIPSALDIVERAVLQKFALDKDNLPMALAILACVNPKKYREQVRKEARSNPRIRRALNRVSSEGSRRWSPTNDELLVLGNFYATKLFPRPLFGMAYDRAVWMLNETTGNEMSPDRYRRILRKFLLPYLKNSSGKRP